MANIFDRNFGCLSARIGTTATDKYLAFELTGKGVKQISSVIAQFCALDDTDVSTIKAGRLLIFREKLENVKVSTLTNYGFSEQDAVLDVVLTDLKPLVLDFSGKLIDSATDGHLTVILLAPKTSDNSDKIGRLTVLGNEYSNLLKGVRL
jgi:hypothetical protein